jgi:phytanoyl-CoA hydroxylase
MTTVADDVQLHPWNHDFDWVDARGPFGVLTEEQAAHFDAQGYVVLPDVFDAEEIAAIRAVTDEADARSEELLRSAESGRMNIAESGAITFTAKLAETSAQARAFVTHPALTGIVADLIGPDANLYWEQAVYKKPEKPRRFPWHQDNGYGFIEPQQYLTCWVALTDATLENGCPQVVPGLHRRGTLRHTFVDPLGLECFSDPADVAVAEVSAGGIVVFSSLTPHLTGPNTTGSVRKAYIVQYASADAESLNGTPDQPPIGRTACDNPDWQFPVVRGGQPVPPPLVA